MDLHELVPLASKFRHFRSNFPALLFSLILSKSVFPYQHTFVFENIDPLELIQKAKSEYLYLPLGYHHPGFFPQTVIIFPTPPPVPAYPNEQSATQNGAVHLSPIYQHQDTTAFYRVLLDSHRTQPEHF